MASQLSGLTREDIRRQAAFDQNFWAGLCIPEVAIYSFPEIFQQVWTLWIQSFLGLTSEQRVFRFNFGIPRGHAKTTLLKLFIAYGIVHKLFNFPLVVCASDDKAEEFLADVIGLLNSPNLVQLYGPWQPLKDKAGIKRGHYLGRPVSFAAYSVLGAIRGLQLDWKRPDCIITDDVQSREVAESEPKTRALEGAVFGTIYKAKDPLRCGIINVGNSFPKNCLLYKIAQSGEFISFITGAVLEDGTALWEEVRPLHDLQQEFIVDSKLGHARIWFAENQNIHIEREGVVPLFPEGDFPLTVLAPDLRIVGAFITIDPAGNKKRSDDSAIVGHIVWSNDKIEQRKILAGRMSPLQTIENALEMAYELDAYVIFPEDTAYQETLSFWFNQVLDSLSLRNTYAIQPLSVGQRSKLSRIRAWTTSLLQGESIVCDEAVKAKVLFQALQFDVERTDNNDNILDACAHGELVRNKHLTLVTEEYARQTRYRQTRAQRRPKAQPGIIQLLTMQQLRAVRTGGRYGNL